MEGKKKLVAVWQKNNITAKSKSHLNMSSAYLEGLTVYVIKLRNVMNFLS